ncbi:cytochrome p450 [Hirsutella rhossiliensis]|uniref:Cytochrome p450 domain-containing protein n=1 Tax=Hirsutella rhossiliensis TaxID=111463 RepID=A0A9P8N6C9_9HYPO|nr:cytochrome p450 domain-containing protein [Hirsutella rhossiliensis]KAH0967770.1 cytochrome p450 domain-containing protein [Hirsutella rhossiliensis]
MAAFFLAMVMFPEVQHRAQEELTRVIGTDRLPGPADRASLPYIDSMVKEVYRWSPIGPMGLVHVAEVDIDYDGYLIPRGSYILPAIWWFCHDPAVYAQPSCFDPERYLDPRNEPDPKSVTFGFGRRICPGRYFADSVIFLSIAQSLAVFDIKEAVDTKGLAIEARLEGQPGTINHPKKFPYRIVPRSAKHADLVHSIVDEQLWEPGHASFIEAIAVHV